MPQPNEDPVEFIKRLAESYRQIRLGRGVVGKTGHATLALLAMWGIVVWRLSNDIWLNTFLLIAGIIATCIYAWWVKGTHKFAAENPAQALLEGAELIEYQRFEAQAKGLPTGNPSPLTLDPATPPSLSGNPQNPDR